MPIPPLALQESLLTDGGAVEELSGHIVNHITFTDADKATKQGFKKLCKDDYPSLLAKYVVAFSVLVRMSLGEKAAEDRLVYDDQKKIIGTASINVPNFIPFYPKKSKKPPPKNLLKLKLAVPDVKTLIKKNVARLLVAAIKHKQNDLHTGNISVNGLIDWDEYYYDLTSIIKGKRVLSSPVLPVLPSPKDMAEIKEEDIRNLPRAEGRVHWVGNSTDWLPSRAPKTTAFSDLEEKKENKKYKKKFKEQCYRAVITELLSFDKKILAERLSLCLGDEKLNLEELPPDKHKELLEFGKNRFLFFDKDGRERSFVDHCLVYFEQEHEKFKRVMLNMPEIRNYITEINNNPKKLLKIKKQFIKQNITSPVPHDLNKIGIEFHSIWRTCNQSLIEEKMKSLKNIIMLHRGSPLCKSVMNEDEETSYLELNEKLSKFTKPDEGKSALSPLTVRHETKPNEIKKLSGILHLKIRKQVINLHDNLSNLFNEYYAKPNATIKDNHNFIEEVKNTMLKNEEERKKLSAWFQEKKAESQQGDLDVYILLMQLIREMELTFKKLDAFNNEFQETLIKLKLNQTIEDTSSTLAIHASLISDAKHISIPSPRTKEAKISLGDESDSETDDENEKGEEAEKINIDQLSTLLNIWNKPEKSSLIKKIIHETRTQEYYSYFYFLSRRRGPEEDNKPLNELFSEGGWESTSLNTLVMKKVCLTMLTEDKADPFKKSIHDRIANNDIEWWSKIAPEIAKQYISKISTPKQSKLEIKFH